MKANAANTKGLGPSQQGGIYDAIPTYTPALAFVGGPGIPGRDGEDAEPALLIPGPAGPAGAVGAMGMPGLDGEDGAEPINQG